MGLENNLINMHTTNKVSSWGPLQSLIEKQDISEIFIQSFSKIYCESTGAISETSVKFESEKEYEKLIESICSEANVILSLNNPYPCFTFQGLRIQIALHSGDYQRKTLSIRKRVLESPTLGSLHTKGWSTHQQLDILNQLILDKKNILFVGATGSGKTTALSACLQLLPDTERIVTIEDSQEIILPNEVSISLLTQEGDSETGLKDISLKDLIKHSLRLRPERLILGELRSDEAKDFLLALSTGHAGSMSSIHASSAEEALIRLEMLIQMGAPYWPKETIRRLLHLGLNAIVTVEKKGHKRYLKSIHRIYSLEPSGFILEQLDDFV